MPLSLPTSPLPKSATPRPLVFGAWLTPTGGGEEQWLERFGSRYALDVVTPNLKPEPDGRLWTGPLRESWFHGATLVYPWPQPGLVTTGSGAPVVDGAGQTGSSLAVRGLTPGYTIVPGQFLSIVGSRRSIFSMAAGNAAIVVGASGRVTIPITPMLRAVYADGAAVELDVPKIEGKAAGNAASWTMIVARVQGLAFSIEEIG